MVNIFVDARCLQDPDYAYRGVGRHSSHMLRRMKGLGGAEISLIALNSHSLPGMSDEHRTLFDDIVYRAPFRVSAGDVFFQLSPMTHDPNFVERLLVNKEIFKSAIIYDFIPYDRAGYLVDERSFNLYKKQVDTLNNLDAYFPISKYSKSRLIDICAVDSDKVHVTGVAVEDIFFKDAELPEDVAILKKARIEQFGYYLFVGGGDQRKNAPLAINATAIANKKIGRKFPLIVCGNYPSSMAVDLARLQLDHDILFLSNISNAEMAYLYRNSILTITPSFIEGFSIPVVEAIAAGSPSFLSNCEAHLELVDTEETLFPPDDAENAAEKIANFIIRPDMREGLVRRQSKNIDQYKGDHVGDVFWHAFRGAYQRHLAAGKGVAKANVSRADGRLKIAFVTPWPPEQSGVAEYSFVTCKALSKLCHLDVFTQAQPSKLTELPEGRILGLDSPELDSRNYDQVFHVIGNSHFHKPMLERLIAHGGAAIVHDSRLLEYYYWHLSREEMLALTERFVGRPITQAEIESWIHRPPLMETLFLEDVIKSADPIIVHHPGFADEIHKRYGLNVEYVPFAITKDIQMDLFTDERKSTAKVNLRMDGERIAIVSFGSVARVKGNRESVYAIKYLVDWGYPVDLWFVGAADLPERVGLQALAEELGVAGNLHFTSDYVTDGLYQEYMFAADFAIQLRKVGLGQGSGTVADCASIGLPCVSNQNVADSVEAPAYIMRVPDILSPVLIAEKIANSIDQGMHRVRQKEERERYVAEHNPESYAKKLIKVIS